MMMLDHDMMMYLVTTGIGLILSGIGWMIHKLSNMSHQINEMNASYRMVRQWQTLHENAEKDRYGKVENDVRDLRSQLIQLSRGGAHE